MSTTDSIVGLGTRTDYVAVVPNLDLSRVKLTTEERAILVAVGKVATIGEVLSRVGLAEPRAIAAMLAMRARGVLVPARVQKPATPTEPLTAAAQEQVDLDEDRKKEILELERTLDGKNLFEVLGVPVGAPAVEVKRAYHELSRRFHPDRFFNRNLGSYRARIERIYKRIAEASAVLSDEAKRQAYLKARPELAPKGPTLSATGELPAAGELDPARAAERRARMARHPYLAKARHANDLVSEARELMGRGEFAHALSLLNNVSQFDPRHREVQAMLQEARKKHDAQRAGQEIARAREAELAADLPKALASYRIAIELDSANALAYGRSAALSAQLGEEVMVSLKLAQKAVELEPSNAVHRALYARLLLETGAKKLARKEFEETLRLDPDHAEARTQLRKMKWSF